MPSSPPDADLLYPWLSNEFLLLLLTGAGLAASAASTTNFMNRFTRLFRILPLSFTDAAGAMRPSIPFGGVEPAGRLVFWSSYEYIQNLLRDDAAGGALFNLTEGLGIAFCPRAPSRS